ncbi:hypothetical protein I4U23_027653 [Adineta vaga]|nr:hypothetical protein I4U23_027653 [Adineta vaga]
MNQFGVCLLDLPDELLLIILKKLSNTDVLYSLLNIDDERLDILAKEKIFSNILDFVSFDPMSSIDRFKLKHFCIDILPKIHENVKYFILKPEFVLPYLTNGSPLRHIFQEQITHLILVNHDKDKLTELSNNYTVDVYERILKFFKNLKHLNIIGSVKMSNPYLSLVGLPPNTFHSSILTYLSIDMCSLDDCLYLLDGRLKQLTTLNDNLPHMTCFSLKCDFRINLYDTNLLPLFRRMSNLEKLTLYLRIKDQDRFVDGTLLQNEILVHMPHLHWFTFYICTYINTDGLQDQLSSEDIQRIFTNIEQHHVVNIINHSSCEEITCSVFSIPFTFDHLEDIGHMIPNIRFNYVTYLVVRDVISFNREFFIQLARAFPLLMTLRIFNREPQSCQFTDSQSYEIAKYPHLTYLDIRCGNDYIEQFLNETKTYVPCLTKLRVVYNNLRIVTNNFTRKETRRNCAKIKQLLIFSPLTEEIPILWPIGGR